MPNTSLGERLKAERERLRFTQPEFAELAGASKRTQIGWEQGRSVPDATALAAWAEEGLDLAFVITGQERCKASPPELPADEQLLLEAYRGLAAAKRKELLASLLTGGVGKKPAKSGGITVSGSGNRTAGRDYHERE